MTGVQTCALPICYLSGDTHTTARLTDTASGATAQASGVQDLARFEVLFGVRMIF
mgnify:CR=1 FL=1